MGGAIVTNCDVLGKTTTARGESGSRVERRNQLITWQWVLADERGVFILP